MLCEFIDKIKNSNIQIGNILEVNTVDESIYGYDEYNYVYIVINNIPKTWSGKNNQLISQFEIHLHEMHEIEPMKQLNQIQILTHNDNNVIIKINDKSSLIVNTIKIYRNETEYNMEEKYTTLEKNQQMVNNLINANLQIGDEINIRDNSTEDEVVQTMSMGFHTYTVLQWSDEILLQKNQNGEKYLLKKIYWSNPKDTVIVLEPINEELSHVFVNKIEFVKCK